MFLMATDAFVASFNRKSLIDAHRYFVVFLGVYYLYLYHAWWFDAVRGDEAWNLYEITGGDGSAIAKKFK